MYLANGTPREYYYRGRTSDPIGNNRWGEASILEYWEQFLLDR